MNTIQKLIEATDEPLVVKSFKLTRSMARFIEDLAYKYDVDTSRIIRERLQPLIVPDAMPDSRLDFIHKLCNENEIQVVENNAMSTTPIESNNEVAALKEQIAKLEKEKGQLEKENDKLVNEANEWSLDLLDLQEACLDSGLMDDIISDRKELEKIITDFKKESHSVQKKILLEQAQKIYKHISNNMLGFKGVKNGQLIDRYMDEKKKLSALKRRLGQLDKLPPPMVKTKPTAKKVSTIEILILNGEEWEIVERRKNGIDRIRRVDDKLVAGIYYPKEGRVNLDGEIGRSGKDIYVTVGNRQGSQN